MLARLQALSDDHFGYQPRRDHLEPRRHPGALRRAAQAHHRQRLQRGRARPVARARSPAPTPRAAPAAGARGRRRAMVLSADGDHPMTRLSDTQLVILGAAAQRDDLSVLPLPDGLNLKGGALNKVMDSLRNRGLIRVLGGDGGPSGWSSPARAWPRSASRPRPDAAPATADTRPTSADGGQRGRRPGRPPRPTARPRRRAGGPRARPRPPAEPGRRPAVPARSPRRAPAPSRRS